MTMYRDIPIASIDVGARLRALDPAWVTVLAEDIGANSQALPIRVVERAGGFKLIDGARRIAALASLGKTLVEARVEDAEALADDAAVRLGEIKGNMLRGDLTALDRAVYIAAWCDIYQAAQEPARRGRKPAKPADDVGRDELSAKLALNWTEAAQAALKVGRRTIFRSLKIADIDGSLRSRIALLPVAENQSELLVLADCTPVRQAAIVDLLTADPAKAETVTAAADLLDGRGPPAPIAAYERLQERFTAMKPAERFAFFEMNAEAIEEWLAARHPKPQQAPQGLKHQQAA